MLLPIKYIKNNFLIISNHSVEVRSWLDNLKPLSFAVLLFFWWFSPNLYAQKHAENWVFGCSYWMTFNSGTPKNGPRPAAGDTWHSGGSVVSNERGRLVFYAAHNRLYDSTQKVMPKGNFKGAGRTIQSSLIVPWPDSSHLYFVFSPGGSKTDSFRYSVVNMKLRGGLGDLDTTRKDITLPTLVAGKVAAVQHAGRRGYWVVTPQGNSDTLCAYLITASGIHITPVKSKTGIYAAAGSTYFDDYYGYLKLSPDGRKICNINRRTSSMFADFDPATGKISNVWDFMNYEIGISFSPNSKYLYALSYNNVLSQYNASAFSQTEFLNSRITLDSVPYSDQRYLWGSLQNAPDGKIYIHSPFSTYLQIIHAPDSAGKSSRIQRDGFLHNGANVSGHIGLPNFVESIFHKPSFEARLTCGRDTVFFKVNNTYELDSVIWNFDDPGSGSSSYSRAQTGVYHVYTKSGQYTPRLICYYKNFSDTIIKAIFLNVPKPYLGKDTVTCKGVYIGLYNRSGIFKSYKWNTGESRMLLFATQPGAYILRVKDFDGCESSDTIVVKNTFIKSDFTLSDSSVCLKQNGFTFKDVTQWNGNTPKSHYWYINNDQIPGDSIIGLKPFNHGTYTIKLISSSANDCADSIIKTVSVKPDPVSEFQINDTSQCIEGNQFDFNNLSSIASGTLTFDWDLGDLKSTQTHFLQKSYKIYGRYTIILTAESEFGCRDTSSKTLSVLESPVADFSWIPGCADVPVPFQFTGKKTADSVQTELIWNFNDEGTSGADQPDFLFKGPGIKKVRVIALAESGCSDSLEADVAVKSKAKADFQTNDLCEGDSASFTNTSSNAESYFWKFGDGTFSNASDPKHLYRTSGVSTTFNATLVARAECADSVSKAITVNTIPESDFDFTISGRMVYFNAEEPNEVKYKWIYGDGSSDSSNSPFTTHHYLNNPYGTYQACLEVTNLAGCTSINCREINISASVSHITKPLPFNIYPNPGSGKVQMAFDQSPGDATCVVYNATGQLILTQKLTQQYSDLPFILPSGVYYLCIQMDKSFYCIKYISIN